MNDETKGHHMTACMQATTLEGFLLLAALLRSGFAKTIAEIQVIGDSSLNMCGVSPCGEREYVASGMARCAEWVGYSPS